MPNQTVPEHRRVRYLRDERLRRLGYADYEQYLHSPAWAAVKRRFIAATPDAKCICGATEALDVHHTTYERVGAERLDDLRMLCRDCHALVHVLQRRGDSGLDPSAILQERASITDRPASAELADHIASEPDRENAQRLERLQGLPLSERMRLLREAAALGGVKVDRSVWVITKLLRAGRHGEAARRLLLLERHAHEAAERATRRPVAS